MSIAELDRINEKEWLKMFRKLRHSVVICPKCNKETFFNFKTNTPFQQRQAESR